MLENGVTRYRIGRLNMEIGLPKKQPYCKWCRFVKWESGIGRAYCAITHEYLPYAEGKIGDRCPIEWKEEEGSK